MLPMYRTTTRVLAGGQVAVAVPDLPEGRAVDVIVMPSEPAGSSEVGSSILDLLESLPRTPRPTSYWEERDREFEDGRDSWDR